MTNCVISSLGKVSPSQIRSINNKKAEKHLFSSHFAVFYSQHGVFACLEFRWLISCELNAKEMRRGGGNEIFSFLYDLSFGAKFFKHF